MATASRQRRTVRKSPIVVALEWIHKEEDPPDFKICHFEGKGRGIVSSKKIGKGEFLLVYHGKTINADEGERLEEENSSGYRFFFRSGEKQLCVDATNETPFLGRLVNHGNRKDRNSCMKEVNGHLCLFSIKEIEAGDELLYDYGLKELPWETVKQTELRIRGENCDRTIEFDNTDNRGKEINRQVAVDGTNDLNTELAECGTVEYGGVMEGEEEADSIDYEDVESKRPGVVGSTDEMNIELAEGWTVEHGIVMEGEEEADNIAYEDLERKRPGVVDNTDVMNTELAEGGYVEDEIVMKGEEEADNIDYEDVERKRPGVVDYTDEMNTELAEGGTVEDGIVMEGEEEVEDNIDCEGIERKRLGVVNNTDEMNTELAEDGTVEDGTVMEVEEEADNIDYDDLEKKRPGVVDNTDEMNTDLAEGGPVEDDIVMEGEEEVEDNIDKGDGDLAECGTVENGGEMEGKREIDNGDVIMKRPGYNTNKMYTDLAVCGTVEDGGVMEGEKEADYHGTQFENETESEIIIYVVNEPEVAKTLLECENTTTEMKTADCIEDKDVVEIENTTTEMKTVDYIEDKDMVEIVAIPLDVIDDEQQVKCTTPKEGKWGSVVVVKGGTEIGVYPLDMNTMTIGSAKTDDIIVTTATKHEVFIEVNHFGEVFLIASCTRAVKKLNNNDLFEVGGRAFKWKTKAVSSDEEIKNYTSLRSYEQTYTEKKLVSVRDSSSHVTQEYTDEGEENENLQNQSMYVSGSESDGSEIIPLMLQKIPIQEPDSMIKIDKHEGKSALGVMTVRPKEKRSGKIDYSKQHACLFCGKLDLKIGRHLCSKKHINEREIAQLPPPNKKGSVSQLKREQALDALRNEGDFLYNIDILKNGDKNGFGLIVAKRPEAGWHNPKDYLPCKYCLRFYVKTELWRHGKKCRLIPIPFNDKIASKSDDEEKISRKFIKDCTLLLNGAGVPSKQVSKQDKEDFHFYVFSSLQDDAIGKGLRQDGGILRYGQNEFERLGRRRANEVRYRMRLLERIKQEVSSLNQSEKKSTLASLLVPENFDFFIQAVRIISGISNEKSLNGVLMFEKPQLAKKTGQILKKFGEMSEGEAIVERNKEKRGDLADFLYLYEKKWSSKIGSFAHQTTIEKKFNKKEMLPVTEDLQKLQKYLDKEIEVESQKLEIEPSNKKWRTLAFLILTKITLFNFRRGNECAAMQLTKYQQRDDWRIGNQEIYQSLTSFEQALAKKMDLVEVMGKQNKKVPVLLTPATRTGIDLLINLRSSCSIDSENPYVFAKSSRTFITGNEALKHVLDSISELQRPDLLKFPSMRKYLATVVQVFGMKEHDVQEVARHMGHELAVHRKFYRLQDDVIELAKISKLLLAVESGQAHHFKGMSLDDLDLKDFPDQENYPVGSNLQDQETDPVDSNSPVDMEDHPWTEENQVPEIAHPSEPRQKIASQYIFTGNENTDDNVFDASYTKETTDSDSSDDNESCTRGKKRKKTKKKRWTDFERKCLLPLVNKATRERKPPRKEEVVNFITKVDVLRKMKWINVKHQVWATAQTQLKKLKHSRSNINCLL